MVITVLRGSCHLRFPNKDISWINFLMYIFVFLNNQTENISVNKKRLLHLFR